MAGSSPNLNMFAHQLLISPSLYIRMLHVDSMYNYYIIPILHMCMQLQTLFYCPKWQEELFYFKDSIASIALYIRLDELLCDCYQTIVTLYA